MPSPAKSSAAPVTKGPTAKPAEGKSEAIAPAKSASKPMTPAERMKMIAEAAYYLAEKRGFSGGNELSDWVAAEKQVDAVIAKRG